MKNYVGVTWNSSDSVKNEVGEVNHTIESVTDLFSFVDFEWGISVIQFKLIGL